MVSLIQLLQNSWCWLWPAGFQIHLLMCGRAPTLVEHANCELWDCTILCCGVKASGQRGASLFCWNWSHVLHSAVFFAVSNRAIYGHSPASLSVKGKLSWVMSSFGQKLWMWSVGLYFLFGELESSGKIQLNFSVPVTKALAPNLCLRRWGSHWCPVWNLGSLFYRDSSYTPGNILPSPGNLNYLIQSSVRWGNVTAMSANSARKHLFCSSSTVWPVAKKVSKPLNQIWEEAEFVQVSINCVRKTAKIYSASTVFRAEFIPICLSSVCA